MGGSHESSFEFDNLVAGLLDRLIAPRRPGPGVLRGFPCRWARRHILSRRRERSSRLRRGAGNDRGDLARVRAEQARAEAGGGDCHILRAAGGGRRARARRDPVRRRIRIHRGKLQSQRGQGGSRGDQPASAGFAAAQHHRLAEHHQPGGARRFEYPRESDQRRASERGGLGELHARQLHASSRAGAQGGGGRKHQRQPDSGSRGRHDRGRHATGPGNHEHFVGRRRTDGFDEAGVKQRGSQRRSRAPRSGRRRTRQPRRARYARRHAAHSSLGAGHGQENQVARRSFAGNFGNHQRD